MSALRPSRQMPASAAGLRWRSELLQEALEAGGAQLEPAGVARARQVIDKVAGRTALAGGHTVVALAGATGSGKSSLFNALVGADVSRIGARRPTTSTPTAAIWGPSAATELLDWLGVGARHHVQGPEGPELDGLVLLDLPDFDSRETSHQVEADRVLELVDVFVWVTDPQKYADARLHEDYLAAMGNHETVTVVVLNQVDRLGADEVAQCRADLQRLVRADGAGDTEVVVTSARTGTGLAELRGRIAGAVQARNAAEQRLTGDLRTVAGQLARGVAPTEPGIGEDTGAGLTDALGRAAGIPVVLEAVERDYRRSAWASAGWPFTRWVRAFRPDPLRRLRLGDDTPAATGIRPTDVRVVLGRSSLPPPSPSARSAVQLATREVGDRAGEGLPVRWAEAVAQAATPDDRDLSDSLDQAVMSTSLRTRNPLWWRFLGLLQWLLAAAAVAGLVWLVVLAVLGWMQLTVEVPTWGPLPVPLLMLAGGLVAGVMLAALARVLARVGARRRRRVIEARLRGAVSAVAREHIVDPVRAVLARHRQTREQLESAAS